MSTKQQAKEIDRPTAPATHTDRLVGIKEVQSLIGMGPSSIYAWMREGRFVEPVRLSARCTRWKLSSVQAWIAKQGEETPQVSAAAPALATSKGEQDAQELLRELRAAVDPPKALHEALHRIRASDDGVRLPAMTRAAQKARLAGSPGTGS